MAAIDPTARIDPGAVIGENVSIGPYCVIGPHVRIGDAASSWPTFTSPATRRSARAPCFIPSPARHSAAIGQVSRRPRPDW